MPTITIEVSDEIAAEYEKNPDLYQAAMKKFLINEIQSHTPDGKRELVKIITRLKAPVTNWKDLEREILHGAIGKRA
jgi:hypothetical protein